MTPMASCCLYLLLSVSLTWANILDIQKCIYPAKSRIEQKVLIENYASLIGKMAAKTNVECIFFCMKNSGCQATFFLKSSELCFLLANARTGVMDTTYPGVVGQYTSMVTVVGQEGVCSAVTCPAGSSCAVECDPALGAVTLCVADNSDCDIVEEYTNIRHYASTNVVDETDNGVVHRITYPKTRSDSMLRVMWFANARSHNQQPGNCGRWYLTFNSSECSTPYTIEMVDYSDCVGNMHMPSAIDGTCKGLSTGNVTIEVRVSGCAGYGVSDSYTGWNSARHTTIMEIIPQYNPTKPCPGLSVFNYFYQSVYRYTGGNYNLVFWSGYKKTASDTALRIKYEAVMRVYTNDGNYRCGRWYLKVDGNECSPQGDVVVAPFDNANAYHRDPHHTRTLEAICENITPGAKYIEVWTGPCYYTQAEPSDFNTGWNSQSRLHIEEVRLSKAVDAVYTPMKKMVKNPYFNIVRYHYWVMNSEQDNGVVKENNFVKKRSSTALRVTATGDHRCAYADGECCRWFFKFNGAECTNPDTIEAVYYFNYYTNFHKPAQVSGMCYGLNAGTVLVSYYVGNCNRYGFGFTGVYNAYNGWGSSFHIIVEEVVVESISKCSTTTPVTCA